jgi:F-type H+-transporting ATPase subunit b
MTVLALVIQSGSGSQIAEIAETFGVDWPHLLAQIISFSIVCALLYMFAYRPILRLLAERRAQISQGLANTEKINAALAAIEAERQETIAKAQAEAKRVITEARDVASRLKEREKKLALAIGEQIVTEAREEATREHARMLAELKGEVGRLVVRTTAAVAGKVLSSEDQRRLADESARELNAA